ncbi:PRADC1-like protein [Adelges cooleyi]|uniref:PRADC1-like protein n=1 Tax=Adelges cooleyi TaxID=133065 RepID=UPI00217F6AFB|nr:PRADC1-like protein [Adelges cooleyi]
MFTIYQITVAVNVLTILLLTVLNFYYTAGDLTIGGIADFKEFEYGEDLFFEITHPPELQYTYRIRPAKDIGVPFHKEKFPPKKSKLILVDPDHGCDTPKNARNIRGNVAFVKRGECSFLKKTIVMETCGAKAVVIADNNIYDDSYYIHMIDDESKLKANIPAGFLVGRSGHLIHSTMTELKLKELPIVFPLNMTFVPLHEMNQPPWIPI